MTVSRNAMCPCASGKKYKRCCGADVQSYAESTHESLTEKLTEAINAGHASTIEEFNLIAQQISARQNAQPRPEFLGLSAAQMHRILYYSLHSPEVVTFNQNWLPKNTIALQIFNKLLNGIGDKGVKITAKGNLPLQLCRDILANTPKDLILRFPRIRTETEFSDLHVLRLTGEMAGLIQQSRTKINLSSLTQDIMKEKDQIGLFNRLLNAYVTEFNWAYRDAYPEIDIIQTGWLFSLYCLSLFGHKWRPSSFYADKFLNAFPMVLDELEDRPYSSIQTQFYRCYRARTLERFAYFWGLIEMRECQTVNSDRFEYEVRAPQLSEWLQFHV